MALSLHHIEVPAQPWSGLEDALSVDVPIARLAAVQRRREARDRIDALLVSRLLSAACRHDGHPIDWQTVDYPADGPPRGLGGWSCSVSHGGGRVLLLLAHGMAVGVDVEAPGAAAIQDLRMLLSGNDWLDVQSGRRDPTEAFMRVEAVLKAAGSGLPGYRRLRFNGDDEATVGERIFALRRIALPKGLGCWCAAESGDRATTVTVHEHALADLLRLPAERSTARIALHEGTP